MENNPTIAEDLMPVSWQTGCIRATFHGLPANPLFPVSATDSRGVFYALACEDVRPGFIEIVHSSEAVVRGNHRHARCTETLSVLSGALKLYLLCRCKERHMFARHMPAGSTVQIMPGIAHAIYTLDKTEIVAVFDSDPRQDREMVVLIRN
jgi:dTDP-4-dehydrorhamnose 3,5-epimerase-like enzyme